MAEKSKIESSRIDEIRVSTQKPRYLYIRRALSLLKGENGNEKLDSITLRAAGNACLLAMDVAQIIRRNITESPGLHQLIEVESAQVLSLIKNSRNQMYYSKRKRN
jgi:hypothetical protein